jgi:ribulose-phosphate 3-epimerase
MNVIPVLNCPDADCIKKKLEVLKTFLPEGQMVHLDVTDGAFSAHPTWNDPHGWTAFKSPYPLEVHLMVNHPEEHVDNWLAAGARRIIVHAESLATQSMHEIISAAEGYHAEVMLSSNPDSTTDDILAWLPFFKSYQVLAVHPGAAGQEFLSFVDEKIRFLRETHEDATIEVDGGMNPETIRAVKECGADTIVSSSYIFDSTDPKKAYHELLNI